MKLHFSIHQSIKHKLVKWTNNNKQQVNTKEKGKLYDKRYILFANYNALLTKNVLLFDTVRLSR